MSYPPILDLQSFNKAKDDRTLEVPGAAEAINAAVEVVCKIPDDVQRGHRLGDGSDVVEAALRAAFAPQAVDPPPTPSVAPTEPPSSLGEAGTSNSQSPFTPFCTGTPVSQPNTPHPEPSGDSPGEGQAGTTPRAKGKPLTRRALSAADELSVFDIHNIFRRRWFLSRDHLVANVISAQKAEDGKVFWVEFAPQFHAHLVKCAVALVPRPLNKVKKVMFGYILELLNGEGPQAFFDLSKGQRVASLALKEKRRLARKRNRASRQERRKAAAEAANGKPQRSCRYCKREFATRRAAKRHRCPFSKEDSDESGEASGKGKSRAAPKPNKPAPKTRDAPPNPPVSTMTTAQSQAKKTQDQHPSKKKKKSSSTSKPQEPTTTTTTPGPRQSAATHVPNRTLGRVLASDQPYEMTSDRRSSRLNTETKRRTRRGLLDKLHE
ncbi:hypothetical protein BGW80DRAFT_1458406 [Lactifluus volemus]|nr:hypothetical protein BGW80DRAFT_1458406 [Lactifluus volemus]